MVSNTRRFETHHTVVSIDAHAFRCALKCIDRCWNPEDPQLYTLLITLQLADSKQVIESVACKVGFREVEVRSGRLLVNGK